MKFFFYLFLMFFYVVTTNAATFISISPIQNPLLRRLGYRCDTPTYDMGPMKGNEKRSVPGQCVAAFCSDSGVVNFMSCGAMSFPSFCTRVPGHVYRPYPKCCDTFTCDISKMKTNTNDK